LKATVSVPDTAPLGITASISLELAVEIGTTVVPIVNELSATVGPKLEP
jgi:hypothetical protein